ncbi:GMC oxidoreductase domain-containing protein [Phthorimaea operculella]|nr:GMC oxidoreductase domain-containing protein [Phthorimaea operculella]
MIVLSPEQCSCPLSDSGGPSVISPAVSSIGSGFYLFMILIESYLKGRCNIVTPCGRVESVKEVEEEYDFIVVGAGPAGSIVASRLSEVDDFQVLLLEAGTEEPIGVKVPSFYTWFYGIFWDNAEVSWKYRTEPGNYCLEQEDKGCPWPRGKAVGGSNVLNGMMYHRGHKADYDEWVAAGAKGWSWDENRKYFDLTEGNKQVGSLVSEEYHSADGPLPFRHQPPFLFELMNAINASGLPIVADMNDPNTPVGFAIAQAMNDNGQRYTAARAFLKPKSERPNLSLRTRAQVTRVLIDNDRRAYGVEYIDQDGNTKTVKARKEVILSAGALNTPQILMLSGIGPAETLEKFKITVVADLPVGKNLRNHVGMSLNFMLTKLDNREVLDQSVFTKYLMEQDGPMASTALTQLTGILYSSLADRKIAQPDLQLFFSSFGAECSNSGGAGEINGEDCYLNGRSITGIAVSTSPRSVGYLTLQSADPLDPPLFYPEYFSHPDDVVMVSDAARYFKRIFDTDVMKNKYGATLDPKSSAACNKSEEWSDPWLECMARLHTDAQNHQLGTAAIGAVIDPQLKVYGVTGTAAIGAVIDPQLKVYGVTGELYPDPDLEVYGVTGLRVADASVMPTPPTGNPQAAIMMVGERAAANIKEMWA